jgi:hypothetical protein
VGKVYQLTAIDTATRWAVMWLVLGPVSGELAVRFLAYVQRQLPRHGVPLRAVLTDNGPRSGSPARSKAAWQPWACPITGSQPDPRTTTPSANGFQGTALQECWRPAFHAAASALPEVDMPAGFAYFLNVASEAAVTLNLHRVAKLGAVVLRSPRWSPSPVRAKAPRTSRDPD